MGTFSPRVVRCCGVMLRTCRGSAVAKLWGRLVFTEVNVEETGDSLCCDGLALPPLLCLLWHRKDPRRDGWGGGWMGSLTSPVFIAASQNIREMCPAERLSFTPSHPPFLTPPQHRTCSLLQGKQKKKVYGRSVFSSLRNLCTFCTYAAPRSDPEEGGSVGYHHVHLRSTSNPPLPPPCAAGGCTCKLFSKWHTER